MKTSEKATYRSIETEKLFQTRSGFISRWGFIVIAIILAILLFTAWSIKYPVVVRTNGVLIENKGPITFKLFITKEKYLALKTAKNIKIYLVEYPYGQLGSITAILSSHPYLIVNSSKLLDTSHLNSKVAAIRNKSNPLPIGTPIVVVFTTGYRTLLSIFFERKSIEKRSDP